MLSALKPGKNLFMYLSVFEHAMSIVLLKDQGVAANILCQQNFGRCRDELFAPGEVGVSTSTCYKEVASLFSSSYHLCIYRVSLAVIVE